MGRIVFRAMEPGDVDAAARVYAEAFGYQGSLAPLVEGFQLYLRLQEMGRGGCLLGAMEGAGVVAVGCYVCYSSYAWLGAVSVKPGLQRRGIGTRLMERLLSTLSSVPSVGLDATPAGERLYQRLGFRPLYTTVAYELEASVPGEGLEAYGGVMVEEYEELPGWLLGLDREASGGDRGFLLRLWLSLGGRVLAIPKQGYALLYRGRVGPLMARSPKAARVLLEAAVARGARRLVAAPEANPHAGELLRALGARPVHKCRRMVLGEPLPENPGMIYAASGFLKG